LKSYTASSSGSSARATYAFATRQSTSFVSICKRFSAFSRTRLAPASGFASRVTESDLAEGGRTIKVRVWSKWGVVERVLGGRLFKRHNSRPFTMACYRLVITINAHMISYISSIAESNPL
jgi:hypothetical protein